MRKVKILKDGGIIYKSKGNYKYENEEYITIDFYNLRYADLTGANLTSADLRYDDLIRAFVDPFVDEK